MEKSRGKWRPFKTWQFILTIQLEKNRFWKKKGFRTPKHDFTPQFQNPPKSIQSQNKTLSPKLVHLFSSISANTSANYWGRDAIELRLDWGRRCYCGYFTSIKISWTKDKPWWRFCNWHFYRKREMNAILFFEVCNACLSPRSIDRYAMTTIAALPQSGPISITSLPR